MAASEYELMVHVRPGASRTVVGGEHDGALVVRVGAPALDGRANDAVRAAVAAALGVRTSAVTIRRGATSRRKLLLIAGDAGALAVAATSLLRG